MNNRSLVCLSVLSALSAGSYACDIDADSDTDINDVRPVILIVPRLSPMRWV